MSKELTRSQFLKAGLAAGLGVVAAGSLAGCAGSPDSNAGATGGTSSSGDVAWDKEVDVLVVGSGTAAYAALVAKDAGTENVLIIEKSDRWGGTSAISGCTLYIPMAYCGMENGSEDTREDALKYMTKVAGGRGNVAAIEAYIDNANPFIEWARDLMGWEWTSEGMFRDYYEPYPGYRFFGRQASIVEGAMWSELQKKVDEMGIEVLFETPAKSLVTDDSGAVIGVVAESGGSELKIKAGTCVVMGTGGFDHNKEMLDAYQSIPIFISNAVVTNTGDGHHMGQAIGADLANMDTNWGLPCFYKGVPEEGAEPIFDFATNDWGFYRGTAGAIVVNRHGKRFADESAAYALFNRAFGTYDTNALEYTNVPAFWICDSDYATNSMLPGQEEVGGEYPEFIVQADTLDELAATLGIDAEGLKAEVEAFNANAVSGVDPDFGRGEKECNVNISAWRSTTRELANPVLAPLATPPFYGAVYVPGACGTNGGLRTNEYAQVLDTAGEVIPGLLAVGNCSASITGGQYTGAGMTVGAGSVMSYIGMRHVLGIS